jgi:hypothetical protein
MLSMLRCSLVPSLIVNEEVKVLGKRWTSIIRKVEQSRGEGEVTGSS